MGSHEGVRVAHSFAPDTRTAAKEFYEAVYQPDIALALFFCSVHYDLDALAQELKRLFQNVPVIGCTTCGEIGPSGYISRSFSGVSFSSSFCTAAVGHLDDLQVFQDASGRALAAELVGKLDSAHTESAPGHRFAFMMIDGLSVREESVTHAVQKGLGDIPLFGGSAGDDQKYDRTWVYFDGAFHTDAAVLAVIETPYPFKIFKTQHFTAGEERLVVTDADAAHRIVKEINGLPAAAEYARVIGARAEALNAEHFSAFPVVVRVNGANYVRSILSANPDGSLTFYCAIDRGLILRVAQGVDLVENLRQTFDDLTAELGPLQLVIACDCVLRNLEIARKGLRPAVEGLFRRNHAIGFSTYGEQYRGVHINQTLTGLAVGGLQGDAHE